MNTPIPLSQPDIDDSDIAAVTAVLRTPNLCFGPQLGAFESAFASQVGVSHGVAVSSGTSGLHLCVRALGWRAGDEVLTTPFSFIASANCLLFEDVTPVFVDIDPTTGNLDPTLLEAAITPRTKGILVVHVFGYPMDFTAVESVARRHNLTILEDACEALGSEWSGRPAGSLGDMAVFGFYPNKQITTGEGGMILTDHEPLAEQCRIMRNQGRDPTGGWLDHRTLGYNYRISDIQCALGISQLNKLADILAKRAGAAAYYDKLLAEIDGIHLPPRPASPHYMSWFVYVARLNERFDRQSRDRLIEAMANAGIQCGRYFPPIHLQPHYRQQFGFEPGSFPMTERVADRCIALPFFTQISHGQIEQVAETLARLLPTVEPGH